MSGGQRIIAETTGSRDSALRGRVEPRRGPRLPACDSGARDQGVSGGGPADGPDRVTYPCQGACAVRASTADRRSALGDDSTAVTVAHRLTPIHHSDIVVYLEDGHVRALGSFGEVRTSSGAFHRKQRRSQRR